MHKLYLLQIGLITFSSCVYSQSENGLTTVNVVRRGEKDPSDTKNSDPLLIAQGHEKAKALAEKLKKEQFSAIFSANYNHTN